MLNGWLNTTFPAFPHRALGVSGAALLHEAFQREHRSTVILPAFTSYTLSGAATAAGKRVIHVDAEAATLHVRSDFLDSAITSAGAEDTIVLVDHTCGHPFPGIEALRRRHPGVLIVEDCVRALGGTVDGAPIGSRGDWTLLSLYKTTPGNLNGAILLSRTPLDLPPAVPASVPWRERLAGVRAVRRLHQQMKRQPYSAPDRHRGTLNWTPKVGMPSTLCLRRFERQLGSLERLCELQRTAAAKIRRDLGMLPGLRWIDDPPGCESPAHYLSFTLPPPLDRNAFLAAMHQRGFLLERTWHVVPSFYRGFAETFPNGSAASEFLADQIVHVPMVDFLEPPRAGRFVEALRQVHGNLAEGT